MHFSLTTLIIILIFLIFLSAFFSGSEIGMMSLNRYRLRHLARKKNKSAIRVNNMLNRPDRLLGVILIGNTLANIVASTVTTLIGQRLYGDLGVAVGTLLLTIVILVFAEMTPKTLAALYPQKVAFFTSLPLKILQIVLAPFVHFVSFMAKGILKVFGIDLENSPIETLTGEELRTVVHEAGGVLPIEHKSMILSLFDLDKVTIEDIMVPKAEIVGIDLEQPWQNILEQLETSQHTRLPLYRNSIDDLVGLVHLRDILHLVLDKEFDIESLIKASEPPYFIPEATTLNLQISNFQKMKKRICFVVDEYGDLQGLATLEDILEEVVGEFTTDIASLSRDIIPQEDGSVIVDASITLRQLNRSMKWNLPDLGPRTLSGLIIEYLGYIPPANCCLSIGEYRIEILKVGEKRIQSVDIITK